MRENSRSAEQFPEEERESIRDLDRRIHKEYPAEAIGAGTQCGDHACKQSGIEQNRHADEGALGAALRIGGKSHEHHENGANAERKNKKREIAARTSDDERTRRARDEKRRRSPRGCIEQPEHL